MPRSRLVGAVALSGVASACAASGTVPPPAREPIWAIIAITEEPPTADRSVDRPPERRLSVTTFGHRTCLSATESSGMDQVYVVEKRAGRWTVTRTSSLYLE
jgi:hypothetical protein